jgi:hypothetical protein
MGNRAFQVTRILRGGRGQDNSLSALGGEQISVVVHGAQDSDDARIQGAAMLNVSPSQVTVEEFMTTGLSIDEAISQAQALDASDAGGQMMADWLRAG